MEQAHDLLEDLLGVELGVANFRDDDNQRAKSLEQVRKEVEGDPAQPVLVRDDDGLHPVFQHLVQNLEKPLVLFERDSRSNVGVDAAYLNAICKCPLSILENIDNGDSNEIGVFTLIFDLFSRKLLPEF